MRERIVLGNLSTQDADLLGRLSLYFDDLDQRLQHGQGWLIFNAGRDRGARLIRFILGRLDLYRPFVSFYHLPWRDFALHTYISTIALPRDAALAEEAAAGSPRQREFVIASSVANATAHQIAHADLVILSNIHPTQLHEALALSQTVAARQGTRRATIALTPHDPWELASAFQAVDTSQTLWPSFYATMHATSLIAV